MSRSIPRCALGEDASTLVRYPLRLFFDCSTAHLSVEARNYLDQHARARDEMIVATPFGWFALCGGELDDDLPSDLAAIMQRARNLGAEYLLFDAAS